MSNHTSSEPQPLQVVRRDVLKGTLAAAGSFAAMGAMRQQTMAAGPLAYFRQRMLAADSATPVSLADYQPIALTSKEFATVQAVVDRIIPTDDLGPGAADSGVGYYIDQSLASAYASQLKAYQSALKVLDTAAGPDGFAAASTDVQDAVLTKAEAGTLSDLPDGFFATLLEHTREGYFGDPVHGGNIGFVGWDLIQFPGIKLVWSAEEQALNTQVAPAHKSVADFGGTAS